MGADGLGSDVQPARELSQRFTSVEHEMTLHAYWTSQCAQRPLKAQCTTGKERRIKRWEHEGVIDAMDRRLALQPKSMRIRRATVEHPFGTIKAWMGATHFLTRTLEKVSTEMSLHVFGLQHQTSDQHPWRAALDPGHTSLRPTQADALLSPSCPTLYSAR